MNSVMYEIVIKATSSVGAVQKVFQNFGNMPRLIDRYIFKEWLKALGVTVLLILGILLLEDMYRNLKNFLERGASAKTLLHYYGFVVPNCLGTVLPIALFYGFLTITYITVAYLKNTRSTFTS